MNDHIRVDSWEKLCASIGDDRLLYSATEDVPRLFDWVRGSGKRHIVVTAYSDIGVVEQAQEHPNADLQKLAIATNWEEACSIRGRYVLVPVGPCCVPEKCHPDHRYSLKTERFTWGTFDNIPDEVVCWYTTNANIVHPKVELIPFGLNNDGPGASMLPAYMGREKSKLLYVNFQNNSLERIRLKAHYERVPWVTFRPTPDLPVGQYFNEMADHRFILCPAGNGLDCYRIWESIYLGCYPVIGDSVFARRLLNLNLPVVVVSDLFNVTPDFLDEVLKTFKRCTFDVLNVSLVPYWASRIAREVRSL